MGFWSPTVLFNNYRALRKLHTSLDLNFFICKKRITGSI